VWRIATIIAAGQLAGCAADPFTHLPPTSRDASIELAETAFFPQEAYQCGPAALATVLDAAGVAVSVRELVPLVYIPGRGGSLQTEIVATARVFGRIPYVIVPEFSALVTELDAGRPVLVLQNLSVTFAPAWHYAVVIGYSGQGSEIFLRSGTTRRQVTKARTFAATWRRSDNWGIVLLRPDEIPPSADPQRYLRAVAAAESAGQFDLALPAYMAALEQWPEEPLPSLGIGNIHYALRELEVAESWYRRTLAVRPDEPVGTNNLGSVLVARGRCDEAVAMIGRALTLQDADSPYLAMLEQSAAEAADCLATPGAESVAE
jgi:hypothetical protein